MARITMTGGFQVMPEGEQVLKITAAEYDEDFGKAVFTLTNVKGQTCRETFNLLNQDNRSSKNTSSSCVFH